MERSLASDPTSSQVSWQTAYWTLIPLAISTMTQPSGRICGLQGKYRTYLRCSPVICFADSISILASTFIYYQALPFKDSLMMLIKERFGDDEENEQEGIHALEKFTWIRWLFFMFGTAPPAIKLIAMEGVPWTKTWGVMFLISFLVVEGMVICFWILGEREPVPGSGNAQKIRGTLSQVKKLDRALLGFSVAFYICLLAWAMMDIREGFQRTLIDKEIPWYLWPRVFRVFIDYALLVGEFVNLVSLAFGLLKVVWPSSSILEAADLREMGYLFYLICAMLYSANIMIILSAESLKGFMIDYIFLAVVVPPALFARRIMGIVGRRFPKLARGVFITWPSDTETGVRSNASPDMGTLLSFVMFVYSVIVCVLWYAYKYNPEGTVNKGWTGVFG